MIKKIIVNGQTFDVDVSNLSPADEQRRLADAKEIYRRNMRNSANGRGRRIIKGLLGGKPKLLIDRINGRK